MNLKSLIQRLLDSRTTPEEAGHSAMPSTSETVLLTQDNVYQSWGTIHQGVAAADGYVNIYARANNSDNAEMRVLTSNMTFSSGQTNNNMDMACSAPVAKGQSYFIKGVQVKAIKIIFVKALGAIGGGYLKRFVSALCQRGELCLKVLSLCLPRSSSRTNPSGSEVNPSRTQLQLGSLFNTPFLINLRLQKMGTSVLGEMRTRSTLVCAVHWLVFLLIQKGIYRDLFPLKKGYLSGFTARQQISNHFTLSSFLCRAANFRTGGALC